MKATSKLVELLADHEIIHPTIIERIFSPAPNTLAFNLQDYAWWKESKQEGEMTLVFSYVEDGCISPFTLDLDALHECMETLEISRMSDLGWVGNGRSTIFGSSPLKEPEHLWFRLQEFLSETQCPYPVSHYLNYKGANSNSYQLCSAPNAIIKLVESELLRQDCKYSTLSGTIEPDKRYFIEIGDTWLICHDAYAEYTI